MALNDLAVIDRLAFWRDVVCTHLYHITADDWNAPETCSGLWEVHDCGPFGFAEVLSPHRRRTRRQTDIARDGMDAIAVQRVVNEPVEIEVGRQAYALQPGDICLLAMDWAHDIRAQGAVGLRSLEIPRAAMAPLIAGGRPRQPVVLSAQSPLGALLGNGLDTAWAQMTAIDAGLGDAVLRNLTGLVALAYGASADGQDLGRQGVQAVRLDSATAYVAAHLADPDLSPAKVAAALRVSVRYLHKLFEPTGESFAQLVTRQRLAAVRAALQSPAQRNRSVAEIAFAAGFNSLPTFYRSFAAAFGASPGDIRAAAR